MSLIGAVAATMGKVAAVSFTTGAVSDFQLSPGSAAAEVTFTSTGTYTGTGNIQGFSGNWITPTSAAGSAYDIRMTVNSGSTPTGSATGIWLSLGTTRTWTISRSGIGTTASNVTIEIRNASTLAVLSDGGGAFDMTADVST
jgi:hypothetical protein